MGCPCVQRRSHDAKCTGASRPLPAGAAPHVPGQNFLTTVLHPRLLLPIRSSLPPQARVSSHIRSEAPPACPAPPSHPSPEANTALLCGIPSWRLRLAAYQGLTSDPGFANGMLSCPPYYHSWACALFHPHRKLEACPAYPALHQLPWAARPLSYDTAGDRWDILLEGSPWSICVLGSTPSLLAGLVLLEST